MARGGARKNAGRPKKPLDEKLLEGNPGKRPLTVLAFPETVTQAEALPPPPEFLVDLAKGVGRCPNAETIFENVTTWLERTGCVNLIPPEHVTEYSLLKARWLECEAMNAKHGLLAKHPTSGQPIASPYVRMSIDYLKAADSAWSRIWNVVSQNSQKEFRANSPHEDAMEKLLSGR
ncbi:hypothetical protein Desaci_1290 [Desulfosporosinus acidiphilus SJ4]|uniref:Phage terminase, small subunit n=1 Tax=Desulfosporosinus acidiphilus (strain DSM 22704 / JCM 16185 / SJ4) TaxID=646529 RepID=I4D3E2_DESAJ|nr:hypothetical protein [Desulfosporosinus acidiphilus]AFM40316.1 hypothetical protein Desaci_1290 [Desulfosporosinus acidiphilus SJ4]